MLLNFLSSLLSDKMAKDKQFLCSVKIWFKDHLICTSFKPHRTVMNGMHQLLNKIIVTDQ